MKKYRTEDGYTFYLLDDGRVVDSLDDDKIDMSWSSFDEFMIDTENSVIEIVSEAK